MSAYVGHLLRFSATLELEDFRVFADPILRLESIPDRVRPCLGSAHNIISFQYVFISSTSTIYHQPSVATNFLSFMTADHLCRSRMSVPGFSRVTPLCFRPGTIPIPLSCHDREHV